MSNGDTLSCSSMVSSERERDIDSSPVFINPFSQSSRFEREGDFPPILPDYASNTSHLSDLEPAQNILPLYNLYNSAISKSRNNSVANRETTEPPVYDTTHSNDKDLRSILEHIPNLQADEEERLAHLVDNDNISSDWQNTFLSKTNELDNLNNSNNEFANAINLSIHFTKEFGENDNKESEINVLNHEYKQGDIINGYILVKNTSSKPIPFEAFYVVFEGILTISSLVNGEDATKDREITQTKKFLEMFDFDACWNNSNDDMTSTDNIIDPEENTNDEFGDNLNYIRHNYEHKRFFTFKIPEKLLDSSCPHNLSSHTQLPPTLGLTRAEKKFNLKNPLQSRKIRDFSFLNSSIIFSITARFIGEASMYGESSKKERVGTGNEHRGAEELLILRDTNQSVRIVKESTRSQRDNDIAETIKHDAIMYKYLITRLDEHLEFAESVLKDVETTHVDSNIHPLEPRPRANTINQLKTSLPTNMPGIRRHSTNSIKSSISSNRDTPEEIQSGNSSAEFARICQLYRSNFRDTEAELVDGNQNNSYKVIFPWQKRTLTLTPKYLGAIMASTPKTVYSLLYIEPLAFRQQTSSTPENSWQIEMPIELNFIKLQLQTESLDKKVQFPEVKKIDVEMICLSIKSDHGPIPFVINNDMLFKDTIHYDKTFRLVHGYNTDYLEMHIVQPIREKFAKIQALADRLGRDAMRIDSKMAKDVKSICNLESKFNVMIVEGVNILRKDSKNKDTILSKSSDISKIPWSLNDKTTTTTYTKSFSLQINLTASKLKTPDKQQNKSYDNFCLVPNFQMCNMVRLYYFRVCITMQRGDVLILNVPFEVVK